MDTLFWLLLGSSKKVIWLLLSLASVAALSYHLYKLISTYALNDVTTDVKYNNDIRKLDFPGTVYIGQSG